MEDNDKDGDDVVFVRVECGASPPLKNDKLSLRIFDAEAKTRARKLVEKASALSLMNKSLNDSQDFKEVPKLKSSRLKLKSAASSRDKTSAIKVKPLDSYVTNTSSVHRLPTRTEFKGSNMETENEHPDHHKNKAPTESPSKLNEIRFDANENTIDAEGALMKTCILCGQRVEKSTFAEHRQRCMKGHFSKTTETGVTSTISERIKCPICQKDLSHMNYQRQTQHTNHCLNQVESDEEINKKFEQQLLLARNAVLPCPLCRKKFKTKTGRQAHLKKCATLTNMTVEQVKTILRQQEEEHNSKLDAGILPEELHSKLKKKSDNQSKPRKPKNQEDEETQLALALSKSLAEDEAQLELDVLGSLAMVAPTAAVQHQVQGHNTKGKGKKNKKEETGSLLLSLSKEEAMERISHRVYKYIFSTVQSTLTVNTPPFSRVGKPVDGSVAENIFWHKAALDAGAPAQSGREEFYVRELMPQVSVSTVEAGSKLKRLSVIPGRRRSGDQSPEEGQRIEATGETQASQTVEILAELAMESDLHYQGSQADASQVADAGHLNDLDAPDVDMGQLNDQDAPDVDMGQLNDQDASHVDMGQLNDLDAPHVNMGQLNDLDAPHVNMGQLNDLDAQNVGQLNDLDAQDVKAELPDQTTQAGTGQLSTPAHHTGVDVLLPTAPGVAPAHHTGVGVLLPTAPGVTQPEANTSSGLYTHSPNKQKDPAVARSLEDCLAAMVSCPLYSDLSITGPDGGKIPAHKVIVHARCPQLLSLAVGDIIDLSSYNHHSIICVLTYIYSSQIVLPHPYLSDVVKLANKFNMKELAVAAMGSIIATDLPQPNRGQRSEVKQEMTLGELLPPTSHQTSTVDASTSAKDNQNGASTSAKDYQKGASTSAKDYQKGASTSAKDYQKGASTSAKDYQKGASTSAKDYQKGASTSAKDYQKDASTSAKDYQNDASISAKDNTKGASASAKDNTKGASASAINNQIGASTSSKDSPTALELTKKKLSNTVNHGTDPAADVEDSTAAHVEDSTAALMEDSTDGHMEDSTAAHMEDSTAALMEDSTAAHVEDNTTTLMKDSTAALMEDIIAAHIEDDTATAQLPL
ncbi:uncharacterized protein LOC131935070 [Physella acuta]|uniref:uncharacterized protein LOC131935070 n=1 Tax=Physella acuta TaxID=109671 RepID=UPI0027DAE93E|nr:uncharacterized protein LOC131935070 [Physella acuta]